MRRTQIVVALEDVLIGVEWSNGGEHQVAAGAGEVRRGVVLQEPIGIGAEASLGDDAAGEHGAGGGILGILGRAEGGVVAIDLVGHRDGPGVDGAAAQALEIEAAEEEELVLALEDLGNIGRARRR